jgi:hypothetical protein
MSNGRRLRRSMTKPTIGRNQLLREHEAMRQRLVALQDAAKLNAEEQARRERLSAAGIVVPE